LIGCGVFFVLLGIVLKPTISSLVDTRSNDCQIPVYRSLMVDNKHCRFAPGKPLMITKKFCSPRRKICFQRHAGEGQASGGGRNAERELVFARFAHPCHSHIHVRTGAGLPDDEPLKWPAEELGKGSDKSAILAVHHHRDPDGGTLRDQDIVREIVKPRKQVKSSKDGHTHMDRESVHDDIPR